MRIQAMTIKQRWSLILLVFFCIPFVTHGATLSDLIVIEDMTLSAGSYEYDSIVVQTGATLLLESDLVSSSSFKGVQVQAENITVEAGAYISANGAGYPFLQGPGAASDYRRGGSYGGAGKGNSATSTYGSSVQPVHLGSGGGYASGGGAIDLIVTGTLHIDGTISADGNKTGSGGSINITTDTFSGSGAISAQGGQFAATSIYIGAGGGGRVFVGYNTNIFSGFVIVRGGRNNGRLLSYTESGTAALYDQSNDHIQTLERWQLDGAYGPFRYSSITSGEGEFIIENNADVLVDDFNIEGVAAVTVDASSGLEVNKLTLTDSALLSYGGSNPLSVDELRVEDLSKLQGSIKTRLVIDATTMFVDAGAQVHVDGMGYGYLEGPGSPDVGTRVGGSHGGLARGVDAKPVYGSREEPVTFGSAGDFYELGGGALKLNVSGTLHNEGLISAKGMRAASGGSVWINAERVSGSGIVQADGGNFGSSAVYIGAGAGGRVAMYTRDASSWTGTSTALGGLQVHFAGSPIRYAGNGTVFFEEDIIEPIDPLLLQYMPILYMHEDEDYFPMNVESFVDDSALWEQAGSDTQLQTAEELTFDSFETMVQAGVDTSSMYLAYSDPDNKNSIDLANAHLKYGNATSSGEATTTVYVHKMIDNYIDEQGVVRNFIVLQYWYFYAMNNWNEQGGFNDHEGDWESVFIFLDADTEDPVYVAYSAHHNDGVDENQNPFQYDSVRRGWESADVTKDSERVASFVSLGSHANYSNNGDAGEHSVPDFSPFGDQVDQTMSSGRHLTSGAWGRIDYLNMENNPWFIYEGKWGTDTYSIGGDGSLGPNFTQLLTNSNIRFRDPIEWAGINQLSEFTVEEPTSSLVSNTAQVDMQFTEALQAGTVVTIDPHQEYISFGLNVAETDFLPRYYDFDTSMLNGTFEVAVTLAYTDEELVALGLEEDALSIWYYNTVTDSWEEVGAIVDVVLNTISFTTNHFSRYAIGVATAIEYTTEDLFDLFRTEVDTTGLRPEQKSFLKKYSSLIERFTNKDTKRSNKVIQELLKNLTKNIKMHEKSGVLTSKETDSLLGIITEIQEKM